jgi:Rrf2 family protein
MKLQISSRLAIFAVLELAAAPDCQRTVAEICDKYGVSRHHLAKVMHVLSHAGLVQSVRGAKGGYQFSGNARRTTLLDIIQLFEISKSGNGDTTTGDRTIEGRSLREILGEIDDIVCATLGSITISTILKLIGRRRSLSQRSAAAAL